MHLIPQEVLDNWKAQYNDGSELWDKYPKFQKPIEEIISLIESDLDVVNAVCVDNVNEVAKDKTPIYLATAGAPLSGKSTVLEQVMQSARYKSIASDGFAKVDPDRWGMLFMVHMYHNWLMSASTIADAPDFETAQKRAYDIARPASNYIALDILQFASENNYNIAHGTTMTSPHIGNMLQWLKEHGYRIDLLLCSAEDEMRAEAAEYRSGVQGYYQSTPEDALEKGLMFPQRMRTYFENADNLHLFWRAGVNEDAVHAATYSIQAGTTQIHNAESYGNFWNKYERDCHSLKSNGSVILPSREEVETVIGRRYDSDKPGSKITYPSPK